MEDVPALESSPAAAAAPSAETLPPSSSSSQGAVSASTASVSAPAKEKEAEWKSRLLQSPEATLVCADHSMRELGDECAKRGIKKSKASREELVRRLSNTQQDDFKPTKGVEWHSFKDGTEVRCKNNRPWRPKDGYYVVKTDTGFLFTEDNPRSKKTQKEKDGEKKSSKKKEGEKKSSSKKKTKASKRPRSVYVWGVCV